MPPDAPPDLPPDGVRITPDAANPVVVEVLRGGHVESRHRGAAIAVRADGHVALSWGDVDRPVFPRSAIKPLQALPLIETGAADAFGLDEAEIALACASHNGEPLHTDRVAAWLARLGLSEADLECGAHWPKHEPAAHDLARAGAAPSALHNNCSGKHAGFLTTAVHRGEPTAGYVHRHHPVQQRVMGVMEQMCGLDLSAAPCGIDGCSIPTFALPL
ncbi:MAG: asparaginase, partial [Rhodobacterales bacterium]|nr:asparaginase [Rhodobacterales bacterium]